MPSDYLVIHIHKFARVLRNNPSPSEIKLGARLRKKQLFGARFRRQHPIGIYIVDFCAPTQKLIIELDGNQYLHQAKYDNDRTRYLQSRGYRVLRFWNSEIENHIDVVVNEITQSLKPPSVSPIS